MQMNVKVAYLCNRASCWGPNILSPLSQFSHFKCAWSSWSIFHSVTHRPCLRAWAESDGWYKEEGTIFWVLGDSHQPLQDLPLPSHMSLGRRKKNTHSHSLISPEEWDTFDMATTSLFIRFCFV